MKNKIIKILKSKQFLSWISSPKTIEKHIKGGANERELLIRNYIFNELNKQYPNQFFKERNYVDLTDVVNNKICEFGHSMTWQPANYTYGKILQDYVKRAHIQNDPRPFNAVFILNDVKKCTPYITYKENIDRLNQGRTRMNRKEKLKKISDGLAKIGCNLPIPISVKTNNYEVDIYIIVTNHISFSESYIKHNFGGEFHYDEFVNKYNIKAEV